MANEGSSRTKRDIRQAGLITMQRGVFTALEELKQLGQFEPRTQAETGLRGEAASQAGWTGIVLWSASVKCISHAIRAGQDRSRLPALLALSARWE
jgi:hypothetical protein